MRAVAGIAILLLFIMFSPIQISMTTVTFQSVNSIDGNDPYNRSGNETNFTLTWTSR